MTALVGITPIMHNFWDLKDTAEFGQELIQFLKVRCGRGEGAAVSTDGHLGCGDSASKPMNPGLSGT
eukprot:376331-Ditylum_brightwellii.AAC.1